MNKSFAILILSFTTAIGTSNAQSFYSYRMGRDLIASFGTGTATYFGDLKDPKDYMDAKPNINVGIQYYFHPQISARAEVNWFRLRGDDSESEFSGRSTRNLSFLSDNFEVDLVGMISLMPTGRKFYQRPYFNPYAFAGLGLLYFNPKGEVPETDWNEAPLPDAGKYIPLQPLMTEGVNYKRMSIVVPFGFGIKCKINPFINIAIEGGYRLTFTDYLDDVSTVYQQHSSLNDDPLAQAMADKRHELDLPPLGLEEGHIRGNPDNNDGYFLMNIKLEYYLPNNFLSSNNYKKFRKRPRRPRRR